ncbi:MAG TPA: tetratricopeptide repeat protein [Bryobacteraceae bacterium]|jgi:Tfp pilus assembly protein PilF
MTARRQLWLLPLTAILLDAAEGRFELNGQIEEIRMPVHVQLYGVESPFSALTTSNSHGQFHFRALPAGTYVVSAFVRRHGEARRTVVVTPSLADAKGVIHVAIPLPPVVSSVDRAKRRSMVSVGQLSIPDSARQKYAEAQKFLSKRDSEHAAVRLKEAVEIAPKYAEAWNGLGVIEYQLREYAQAEEYFRKALEADPGNWTPAVNLGGALLNLNRPADALPYNQFAVKARPNDALANSQLGLNYFHLGQMDKAEQYLSAAERLDPSHFSHPQLVLAQIYAQRGARMSTIRELRDFVNRFPDSPTALELRKKLDQVEKPASQ